MSSQLVVVATFANESASLIARAILDANDIPSMVASDGSSSMEPQLQFSQGVRLLVREDHAEDARALLEEVPEDERDLLDDDFEGTPGSSGEEL